MQLEKNLKWGKFYFPPITPEVYITHLCELQWSSTHPVHTFNVLLNTLPRYMFLWKSVQQTNMCASLAILHTTVYMYSHYICMYDSKVCWIFLCALISASECMHVAEVLWQMSRCNFTKSLTYMHFVLIFFQSSVFLMFYQPCVICQCYVRVTYMRMYNLLWHFFLLSSIFIYVFVFEL